jgi:hypothetical protein
MLNIDEAGDEGWGGWEIDASSPIKTSRALGWGVRGVKIGAGLPGIEGEFINIGIGSPN